MTKTKAFLTYDNRVFLTREDAQKHELETLLGDLDSGLLNPGTPTPVNVEAIADWIAKHRDQIVAILAAATARKSRKAAAVNAVTQDMKP